MIEAIKKAIETGGTQAAQVEVRVQHVSVSMFSGKGEIHGLMVANPSGYQSPWAVQARKTSVSAKMGSLFTRRIQVESVLMEECDIYWEEGPGQSNLDKIASNLEAFGHSESKSMTPPGAADHPQQTQKTIQVDELTLSRARVHCALAPGKSPIEMPDLVLRDLGKDLNGLTGTALGLRITRALIAHIKIALALAS
jgi:hypothetical protein